MIGFWTQVSLDAYGDPVAKDAIEKMARMKMADAGAVDDEIVVDWIEDIIIGEESAFPVMTLRMTAPEPTVS